MVKSLENLHKSYRWMYRRYVIDRMTEQEIAQIAGVNQATIHRWLKKHGLTR